MLKPLSHSICYAKRLMSLLEELHWQTQAGEPCGDIIPMRGLFGLAGILGPIILKLIFAILNFLLKTSFFFHSLLLWNICLMSTRTSHNCFQVFSCASLVLLNNLVKTLILLPKPYLALLLNGIHFVTGFLLGDVHYLDEVLNFHSQR